MFGIGVVAVVAAPVGGFGVEVGVDTDNSASLFKSGLVGVNDLTPSFESRLVVVEDNSVPWGGFLKGDLNGFERVEAADSSRRRLVGGFSGILNE